MQHACWVTVTSMASSSRHFILQRAMTSAPWFSRIKHYVLHTLPQPAGSGMCTSHKTHQAWAYIKYAFRPSEM